MTMRALLFLPSYREALQQVNVRAVQNPSAMLKPFKRLSSFLIKKGKI